MQRIIGTVNTFQLERSCPSLVFANSRPGIFNNKAGKYDVEQIMTKDATLDVEAYKNYFPLLQGPRIALAYALSFASISCVLVHAALYDGADLIRRFRKGWDSSEDDIHMQQIRKYP